MRVPLSLSAALLCTACATQPYPSAPSMPTAQLQAQNAPESAQSPPESNCREFTVPVTVGGQQQQAIGQACKQPPRPPQDWRTRSTRCRRRRLTPIRIPTLTIGQIHGPSAHPSSLEARSSSRTVSTVSITMTVSGMNRSVVASTIASMVAASMVVVASTGTAEARISPPRLGFRMRRCSRCVRCSLPGVSAPPPFGSSQRTIIVDLDPDKLRQRQGCVAAIIQLRRIAEPSPLRLRSSRPRDRVKAPPLPAASFIAHNTIHPVKIVHDI
jgi:hypothetical protein